MAESLNSGPVCTRLQRIAELARKHPERVFMSIGHALDVELLREAYRRTRKDGAAGVDGQTAREYERDLEDNLRALLDRLKAGTYRAPPVRRVHIPKGDGRKTRPIGIPTFEDKIAQRAVAMVLEAVYEQDFVDCSYGFRPGRSAHDALQALRTELMRHRDGCWVIEVDIRSFFDELDHRRLKRVLDQRVTDGVLRRLVHKWLHAGVMEHGQVRLPKAGSPQGGVISPLLANVFLHEVMDDWFAREVQPRLRGRGRMFRYADDIVVVLEREDDARRILDVLPQRFGKYGLSLHPDKTRLFRFEPPSSNDGGRASGRASFDFLGFTHHWAKSRKGYWVVKQRTAKERFARAVRAINAFCRARRHDPVVVQRDALARKLRGHYNYYGITGNYAALERFHHQVKRTWRKWLCRRSNAARRPWEWFNALLARFPLPRPVAAKSALRLSAKP